MAYRNEIQAAGAVFFLAVLVQAQVRLDIGGYVQGAPGTQYLDAKVCNETTSPHTLKGLKFRAQSFDGWRSQWGAPGVTVQSAGGAFDYTNLIVGEEEKLYSGNCVAGGASTPVIRNYVGAPGTLDGRPFDPQVLIKTGSCSEVPPYTDSRPLACAEVDAQRGSAAYYGSQCLVDSIGANGGDTFGGFVSTSLGQTQIQAAIPSATITISNTPVKWNPYAMGPQYMMALGMVQEIMNVDMQFLAAIAGKETGAGMVNQANGQVRSEDGSYVDNGTYSYWQIEDATFATYIKAYPQFFPKYGPCLSMRRDVTTSIPACATGWGEVSKFYLQPAGANKMGPNTPQIANGAMSSALAWYGLYDILSLSTDLCFLDAIKYGKDKKIAFAAMIGGYNQGRYTAWADPLRDPTLKDRVNASNEFTLGNLNYRNDVFAILDLLVNASKASQAGCGSVPIYDTAITLREVQRFFFGGSANPGTAQAQGDGGLMLHYPLTAEQRTAMWADLTCTFDKLKGKAPSMAAAVAGKDAISYRYDWLTLLRVAKKHLPFHIMDRQTPVENDFETTVKRYSQNPQTCSGKKKDEIFPILNLLDPKANNPVIPPIDVPGYKFTFSSTDDVAVTRAEWTLDRNWAAWNPAVKTTGSNYEFLVSCERPDYPRKGQKAALWIRTTDDCGNATVQQLDFTTHSTANCGDPPVPPQVATPTATPPGREFSALSPGVSVTLSVATPGASILYTLDGTDPDSVAGGATRAYIAGTVIPISATTTLKARAVAPGMLKSAVVTEVYTKVEPGKTPKPEAIPPGQTFTGTLSVTLVVKSHPSAAILYTLDGTPPAMAAGGSTLLYTAPTALTGNTVITAVAVKEGLYPSDSMTERYTNIPPVPPIGMKQAWYLDEDGDGRIEKAMVLFEKALPLVPEKLGFTILAEDGQSHARTAGKAEMAMAAGDLSKVVVTFAVPFPFGITSLKNAATSGQAFRQDDIPMLGGAFAVADSAAPVIVEAVVHEGDSAQPMKRIVMTYSEPLRGPASSQTAWMFKRLDGEMASADVRIGAIQPDGDPNASVRTTVSIDTASSRFPIRGDSVAIALTREITDLSGRAPAVKLFRVLKGEAPRSKPVRFTILFPNGSSDLPSQGTLVAPGDAVLIPLGLDGTALPGGRELGRCPGCVAKENGVYVGPVFNILTPGPLAYTFRIFNNLGEFVAQGAGRIDGKDLDLLKKDRAGVNYEIPVVWTGNTMKGRKAGTGAYIVTAVFDLDKDMRTGAGPSRHTDKKVFGLIRNL